MSDRKRSLGSLLCLFTITVGAIAEETSPPELLPTANISDEYSLDAWLSYKQHFNKQYPSSRLDALHRTLFARRVDFLKSLVEHCKSEQHYPISRSTDQVRSTQGAYAEPTVGMFIGNYLAQRRRKYASQSEARFRYQIIELYLDKRRIIRQCCRARHEPVGDSIDWTIDEIEHQGGDPHFWLSVGRCNNLTGGRYP